MKNVSFLSNKTPTAKVYIQLALTDFLIKQRPRQRTNGSNVNTQTFMYVELSTSTWEREKSDILLITFEC